MSDIVDGIIASLNDTKGYNIFNLGSDKPISLKNLIGSIESRLNKKAVKEYLPLQEGDVSVTHASITKSQRILGYNPKVSFKIDWKSLLIGIYLTMVNLKNYKVKLLVKKI